jgi:hypothetical protein
MTPPDLAAFCIGLTPELLTARRILEPSCGDGAAFLTPLRAVNAILCDRALIYGIDIHPHPCVDWCGSYLEMWPGSIGERWDLIIGNPPFSLALEFVERSLFFNDEATVAFLLRLSFLESAARFRTGIWAELARVHVLAERPSFTGNGRTDASAYAWFVWKTARPPGPAAITVHSWKRQET